MTFDYTRHFRPDLPAPAGAWSGFPEYNFVGGHNDAASVPVDALGDGISAALAREGHTLATYKLASGPLGHRGLREFVARMLQASAGIACDPDQVLLVSGSLQALDLVNAVFIEPGDTVLVEEATYAGALSRLERAGARWTGIPVDDQGMSADALRCELEALHERAVTPKYVYTIPTVQNPTGTVMSPTRRAEVLAIAREYGVPVFEDDCYADLTFDGTRPPALRAMDEAGGVLYCGSFSKSIAPALRVGYVVAEPPVLARMVALKTDGGGGALEQMALAEFAPAHFDAHVARLRKALATKCDAMVEALEEHFGAAAEFRVPRGGIFIWVTLPAEVDTSHLAAVALAEGVAINPGAEWSADPESGRHRLRLCFGHPDVDTIRAGVARLAEICHRETGIPVRSANVSR